MGVKRCCPCSLWIKYILFVINFLVWVCGLSLIVIGIWARLQKARFGSVDNLSTDPAFFMLMLGIFIAVISTLGWCGALRENLCLLKAFSVSVILLFLLEIVGGILTFAFLDRFQSHLTTYMRKAITIYQDDKDIQNALDFIQKNENHASSNIYLQGCIGPIMIVFKENLLVVGLLAFAVGFIELLSFTLTHLLIRQVMLASRQSLQSDDIQMTLQT